MAKRKVKAPIGVCDCATKGCAHVDLPVYTYERKPGPDYRRRFAGRVYLICPDCGRVENQEFILCNMKKSEPDASSDAAKNPENHASDASQHAKPTQQPTPPAATKQESPWWRNLRPIIQ